jgi:BirA family transcriptional regulator, biotin operon repressor / biotin---[acetyl-CoA-carboxylase] ligase
MPETLPADLARALDAPERMAPFGHPVHYFSETGSTNDVAARLAERGAPEGTTVIASAQTAGRGRLGREWFSPTDAGLYVSVICRNAAAAPHLTLAGGVAVADGIRLSTGLPVEIKWPNDVIVDDGRGPARWRKLAGVLAEASSDARGLQYVVLGFGVNLRPSAYPPAIASRATSLETELGRPVDGALLLAGILETLADHFRALAAGTPKPLLARWRELAPTASGAAVMYETADGRQRGVTAGIGDDGALLVRVGERTERVIAGEIVWT